MEMGKVPTNPYYSFYNSFVLFQLRSYNLDIDNGTNILINGLFINKSFIFHFKMT